MTCESFEPPRGADGPAGTGSIGSGACGCRPHRHVRPVQALFWVISVRLPDPQITDFARLSRRAPGAFDK